MLAPRRWFSVAALLMPLPSLATPAPQPVGAAISATLGPPIIDHNLSDMIVFRPTTEDCPKVYDGGGLTVERAGAACEELRMGKDKVAFALDLERKEVALDLDADGVIRAADWTPMPDVDGMPQANLSVPREVDGTPLQVPVGLRWMADSEFLGLLGATRSGELHLPGGPVRVNTSERSGVWRPWSSLGVDLDRSGDIDTSDRLESGRNERIIALDGSFWHLLVDSRGDTLTATPVEAPQKLLARGAPAPEFDLPGLDGHQYSVARFRGQWLIMDFWGTWCGPCKAALPELIAWKEQQPDDVAVLGMASDKPPPLKAYLKKHPHPWPDVPITQSQGVAKQYGVKGWPTYVLVDPDGNLAAVGAFKHIQEKLAAGRRARSEAP